MIFWRDTLTEFYQYVTKSLTMKKNDLIKAFVIHDRKPTGLSNIIVIIDSIVIRFIRQS